MDWDRRTEIWSDFEYDRFSYQPREATVLCKFELEKVEVVSKSLVTAHDWDQWLETGPVARDGPPKAGICIIRGKPTLPNISPSIYDLPFKKHIFSRIIDQFHILPTIVRTILRDVAHFSIQEHDNERKGRMISCTARTSTLLRDDMAISSTFLVDAKLSLVVVFGCGKAQKDKIENRLGRLNAADDNHPLLVLGMFAEMERIRLQKDAERLLGRFALRASRDHDLDLDMSKAKMTEFLKMCYESRELISHILAFKLQAKKVIHSAEEMDKSERLAERWSPWAGVQIQTRLSDVLNELEGNIEDCRMIMDNMSLTMQTSWNHFAREDNKANLSLARASTNLSMDMRRDSSQMRSNALLTMVFLPLTTLAVSHQSHIERFAPGAEARADLRQSIFSTTFFNWGQTDGHAIVSGYIWVFVVLAVGITTITVGAWYYATHRASRKEEERQRRETLGYGMEAIV
ncbi:uncharacterized protein E0L32_004041 [Thyridium curvatum]|uniref:Uncharacterized protein n=1 Tax=Thyridium curvatum TaxID=1093900 RepID=A0A507B283_9PEZI|nr:uncharacterized protein E0L32_004041 [Thyridium curvatum]TPX16392.1 hypothetical protein E0L32_004041 [Thyridium curvatum]